MIRNLLYLSDDTCISSGVDQTNAIQSCTVTECVNSGEELTLGSTCCACLEVKIIAPNGELNIPTGKEVRLCKEVDGGAPVQVGVFLPERPVKANTHVYKLTAYDKVSVLDKDVSAWLKGLEWPTAGYPLLTFAKMVCEDACGLKLATTSIPNATMPVYQFYKAGVTGRQIMQWIGEIACRFCRANADGDLEFGWYTSSGVTIQPGGERYFYSGALSYEDYDVTAIDAVKLRLADGESGALWPEGEANNPYVIAGNAILLAKVTEDLPPYLEVMREQLAGLPVYRPCKVSLPASLDIRAGHTVQIVDKHGNEFTTLVMTKTQTGQRDTLECTSSARRDSSTAVNNPTTAQVAQNAAQQAVDAQTHEEILNKLTKNGTIQGIFVQGNKWYIDAEQVALQNLKVNFADVTGVLTVLDGDNPLFTAGDGAVTIAGWDVDDCSIRHGMLGGDDSMWLCRTGTVDSPSTYEQEGIADTDATKAGWCITVGNKFGVDSGGLLFAEGAKISGEIIATGGQIGDWFIDGAHLRGEDQGYTVLLTPKGIETTMIGAPTEEGKSVIQKRTLLWKNLMASAALQEAVEYSEVVSYGET